MSLTVILLFAVFILPILFGIFLLRKFRKLAMILLSIPFIFIIGVVGWWFYETNYRFVSDTDLSGEQIEDLSIRELMTEEIISTYGDYEEKDNVNYDQLFVFNDIEIGTSVRDEIIYINILTTDMSTSKGIKVGDSADAVIEAYGDTFFRRSDMGLGESINYVDRDEKIHLQIWLQDDEVTHISLLAI